MKMVETRVDFWSTGPVMVKMWSIFNCYAPYDKHSAHLDGPVELILHCRCS